VFMYIGLTLLVGKKLYHNDLSMQVSPVDS
jgi:hypothetical protein